MRVGLRAKALLLALGLIVLSVLVAYGYAHQATRRQADEAAARDLAARVRLVAARAEVEPLTVTDGRGWDELAGEMAAAAGGRVSFIAPDGRLLGDSTLDDAHLHAAENHKSREEVVAARAGRVHVARRRSVTLHTPMLYAAAPVRLAVGEPVVARLALPASSVERTADALQGALVMASLLALVVSTLAAAWAVRLGFRQVSALTRAASRMAAGDLTVRARVGGTGELAELASALNLLVTNLSRSLDAYKEERDRLSGILSNMEEGVLFLDEHGNVAHVNPALRAMLLLPSDATGRPLLEVVRHAELKEMIDFALDEDEDEDDRGPVQGEIQVHGLKPRQLLVRVKLLDGPAAGVIAVFLDVTETRRLENMRREFVANVSHELRTPVTAIRSAAETLEGAAATQPSMVPRFVDIIARNATRLQALVEDVLDLSRIESRQFSMNLGPIKLNAVVTQQAALFEEKARARDVTISLDLGEELPEVRADRRGLEHVLSNLVDNAVKYAGVGKRVRIGARQTDSESVELSVTDDGPGIEAKHLPRLFERFYRVDTGRSRDLGGTGLGLAIVKHLSESMGARVSVESAVGVGTTFRVELPIVSHGPRSQPPESFPPATA